MSDTNTGVEQATARRLAAALEQYDRQCAEMVRTWLDIDLYMAVSTLVDDMRACCGSLSRLSGPWLAFLISHCDLVFSLYRAGSGCSCSPEVQACVCEHSVALRNLRRSCLRLCKGHHDGTAPPFPRWRAPPR